MPSLAKTRVKAAFDAASGRYEQDAPVQRLAAQTLADLTGQWAAQWPMGKRPRILEIGCGTGLLTRAMAGVWPEADYVVTDLSERMVAQAASSPIASGLFLAMDGEMPAFEGPWFDLIVSSLAFQWFEDLPRALDRLFAALRPGGHLFFSTMADRSFQEWRAAHAAHGLEAGTPAYPTLAELGRTLAHFPDSALCDEDYPVAWGSARAFLHHLRTIGATVPRPGRAPLPAAQLKRVMATFDNMGAVCTYHVAFARLSKPHHSIP